MHAFARTMKHLAVTAFARRAEGLDDTKSFNDIYFDLLSTIYLYCKISLSPYEIKPRLVGRPSQSEGAKS